MRVAVDARTVYSPTRRGTGKNLIDLYSTLAAQQPAWTFLMFHQRPLADDPFAALPNVEAVRVDIPGDRLNLWEDVRLPLAARSAGASVLHCPANTSPRLVLTPMVVTIHDLIPLDMHPDAPETGRWVGRVRRAARRARRIITPSAYTRRRLITDLGVAADKVRVNAWAPDRACRRETSAARLLEIRRKYGVPDDMRYVLAFGAADPRKNTGRMLDAWHGLTPSVREGARLVMVGLQPAALARYQEQVRRAGDPSCLLHGFADESDIAPLLTGATALCYPSLSEGFGLPVLDAFECGTPVITSSTTSLPEVAEDGALLVDPVDTQAITSALQRVLTDEEVREQLRAAGARRLALYSWEQCARTAGEVLSAAAGTPS